MPGSKTSGCNIATMIARAAALEHPQFELIRAIFGDSWTTTNHDAGPDHHLTPNAVLSGATAISFAEFLVSNRYLAQLDVLLTSDSTGVAAARDVRASFTPWAPAQDPLPIGAGGLHQIPSTLPTFKEVCSVRPDTVLTIKSYGDGRPSAIHLRWMR